MAFNFQTFKTRTLTALVFAAVMMTGLLWNSWSFIVLFALIHFGCWYEFVKLVKKINNKHYLVYCLLGIAYISLPVLMMIDLRSEGNLFDGKILFNKTGVIIPCIVIISIWINDSMAYIVGSLIGKTHFSKVSPKKTLEGTFGGISLCVIAVSLFTYCSNLLPVKEAIIIAACCAIFGTAGDLLESKLKRMANVKDSGSLMPGHGGFLDRFDSMLIAVPSVWIYIRFFL